MTEVRLADAVQALGDRCVNDPEKYAELCDPETILRTCEWYDRQSGVGPGLLISKLRKGGVAASADGLTATSRKLGARQARFEELRAVYVEGAVTETHAEMLDRQAPIKPALPPVGGPADRCVGDLVVVGTFPDMIHVECDHCGSEAAYSVRVAASVLPPAPRAVGRPEPSRPSVPEGRRATDLLHRPSEDFKRPDFVRAAEQLKRPTAERAAA